MKKMLAWLSVFCLLLTCLTVGLAVSAAANDDYMHEDDDNFVTDPSTSSSANSSTSGSDHIFEDDATFVTDPSTSSSASSSTSGSDHIVEDEGTFATDSTTTSSESSTSTTQSTTPSGTPAGPDVNLAVDDDTVVTITDKAGTATFDKLTATVNFPDHRDAVVSAEFATPAGALADEYLVSFTASMSGGWESNGVQISWGAGATVSLIKWYAVGGKIVINGQETVYDGIRDALITGTADILAHVYPNESDATKSDVDIYLGNTKLATMEAVVLSDTITLGSVCSAWGDRLKLSNIKIMNNTDSVPAGSTSSSTSQSGSGSTSQTTASQPAGDLSEVIVNGVDTSKKGTGQDIEILAPGDVKNQNENLANLTNVTLPAGVTLSDGVLSFNNNAQLTFDLSGIQATDDYIISFKTQSISWWPHEYMTITFGQNDSAKHIFTFKGNYVPNGAKESLCIYNGVRDGQTTEINLRIPNNTLNETKYVIYVTTSPETGKRRIFFFANNNPLVQVDALGNEIPLVIEDQDVLNPCLIFKSYASSGQYRVSDICAYVAQEPKFKEALIDKEYISPPVPSANASNYADIANPIIVGSAEVKADGTIVAPGGDSPASSVTIPLTGLTKDDAYKISFMTTTCSYDDWQALTVTFGQEGGKSQKFVLRGSTAYSGVYLNGSETRIKATATKGSMTKIDILVTKSVETEKRRILVFQDGKACVMYNNSSQTYETTLAELLDPCLTFQGGRNGTFNIVNLKVFKLDENGNFVSEVKITTQPKHTYTKLGSTAKVTVGATGDGLTYQWYIKNAGQAKYSKSSVTTATYSVKMSDKVKDRLLYCIITDQYGNSVRTQTVVMRMAASVATQPKSNQTQNGATAKVTVGAKGDGLKYQWYVKNAGQTKYSKSSITTATYSVKMSDKARDRYVYCIVTDKYGKTVKTNTVVLRMAASILTQPKTAYAKSGATVKTTVKAAGDGLKYQWYVKNDGATAYVKSSITTATYSAKMSSTVKNRRVLCIITDQYGNKVQTQTVMLKMK